MSAYSDGGAHSVGDGQGFPCLPACREDITRFISQPYIVRVSEYQQCTRCYHGTQFVVVIRQFRYIIFFILEHTFFLNQGLLVFQSFHFTQRFENMSRATRHHPVPELGSVQWAHRRPTFLKGAIFPAQNHPVSTI